MRFRKLIWAVSKAFPASNTSNTSQSIQSWAISRMSVIAWPIRAVNILVSMLNNNIGQYLVKHLGSLPGF